jgi:hypothetical protein
MLLKQPCQEQSEDTLSCYLEERERHCTAASMRSSCSYDSAFLELFNTQLCLFRSLIPKTAIRTTILVSLLTIKC